MTTAACSLKHASCSLADGGNGMPLLVTRFVIRMELEIGAPVTRSIFGSIRHWPTGVGVVASTKASWLQAASSTAAPAMDPSKPARNTAAPAPPQPEFCRLHVPRAIGIDGFAGGQGTRRLIWRRDQHG